MIICKNGDCVYGHCCAECDGQKSSGYQCGCNYAEDLEYDKEKILLYCEFADVEESEV